VQLSALRSSGAFHRVIEAGPHFAFLQLTADPADAARPDFASKLQRAR